MTLAARGFKVLKFFPAEACGGIGWLKSVGAPLPQLRFCPTGGIDGKNARPTWRCRMSSPSAVPGWRRRRRIAAGDFSRITGLARDGCRVAVLTADSLNDPLATRAFSQPRQAEFQPVFLRPVVIPSIEIRMAVSRPFIGYFRLAGAQELDLKGLSGSM